MAGPKHVFISYTYEDAAFVRKLQKRLRDLNVPAWQDVNDLKVGQFWMKDVEDALRNASALVVVISEAAARSEWVTYEWAFALGAEKLVVPALRSSDIRMHPRLANIQGVDFAKHKKPWLRLIDALREPAPRRTAKAASTAARICVQFADDRGIPQKVGNEYRMNVWLEDFPADATSVRYELHDPSFVESVWTERNPRRKFLTTMSSYGDVLLTADIKTPSGVVRAETTLYDALRKQHGRTESEAIHKALRTIERN